MIDLDEAQQLMEKFINLRTKSQETKDPKDILEFRTHEKLCIDKFKYLVTMRTSRYKQFSNYDDLNQEGFEALLKAMKNYNPSKGCWFWWSHKYIDTRISRCANFHTTIRYPLKVAKAKIPHKETLMPLLIEENYCPDKEFESKQYNNQILSALNKLNDEQKKVMDLAYGITVDKPVSINKICKSLNISRVNCLKILQSAVSVMKENIQI